MTDLILREDVRLEYLNLPDMDLKDIPMSVRNAGMYIAPKPYDFIYDQPELIAQYIRSLEIYLEDFLNLYIEDKFESFNQMINLYIESFKDSSEDGNINKEIIELMSDLDISYMNLLGWYGFMIANIEKPEGEVQILMFVLVCLIIYMDDDLFFKELFEVAKTIELAKED